MLAPSSSSPEWAGLSLERSEEHTSELQSQSNLVCRLLLEKKKKTKKHSLSPITSIVRISVLRYGAIFINLFDLSYSYHIIILRHPLTSVRYVRQLMRILTQ